MKNSNSEASDHTLRETVSEWFAHFSMRWRGRNDVETLVNSLDASLLEYQTLYAQYTEGHLSDARVFEIGYGARPLRLMWLLSHGYSAWGIDLDRPVIEGTFSEFYQIFRRNGWKRLLKSVVRHVVFDRKQWHLLDKTLRKRGLRLARPHDRFLVGDAAAQPLPEALTGGIDFLYCEDVLEHMPVNSLRLSMARFATLLSPNGLALFRPHVWTSIGGGHLTEWYPSATQQRDPSDTCRSEPWEHLRKKRYTANTFLNELRLKDYRNIIGSHFSILHEENHNPTLGLPFLTETVRQELSDYAEEELLANTVLFLCGSPGSVREDIKG